MSDDSGGVRETKEKTSGPSLEVAWTAGQASVHSFLLPQVPGAVAGAHSQKGLVRDGSRVLPAASSLSCV